MSGYEAEIGAIRTAAGSARSAGEQAGGVDLAGAVADAGAAVPGATAAKSLTALSEAWRTDIADWAKQASGYATSLTSAADRYADTESAAEADLARMRVG